MSTLTLTQRAEQALIGALLSHPWQFVVFDATTSADFADARLARVYGAMMECWGTAAPGTISVDLAEITATSKVPLGYLEYLKSVCPAPLHAGAYDRLVAEAAARRQIRAAADDLANRALARGYGPLAGHSLMVATAIRRNSALFNPDAMTAALARPAAITGTKREAAEEAVLSAILTQHPETMPMLEILRPEVWSDQARSEMHTAMVTLAASARDIDPLTVDWEISCGREQGRQLAGRVPAESAELSYAMKVAGKSVPSHPVRTANALVEAAGENARRLVGRPAAPAPALLELPPPAPVNGHVPGQRM